MIDDDDAFARRDDPWTSWAAAHSLHGLPARRVRVLRALVELFPEGATLEELEAEYRRAGYPPQSPSGIRTRCRELQDAGYVLDTGRTRPTRAGRDRKSVV